MKTSPLAGSRADLGFRLPTDHRPAVLAEPVAAYDRAAIATAEAQGELADAKEAVAAGKQRDLLEFADRLRKRPDAKFSGEHETAARERVAALEEKLKALDINADRAGNDLVSAVTPTVATWLEDARETEDAAAARCRAALDQAVAALEDLSQARSVTEFLSSWNETAARHPSNPTLPDVRNRGKTRITCTVQRSLLNQGDEGYDVAADVLVAALRRATEPPAPPPEPRTHTFAAESSEVGYA